MSFKAVHTTVLTSKDNSVTINIFQNIILFMKYLFIWFLTYIYIFCIHF